MYVRICMLPVDIEVFKWSQPIFKKSCECAVH
jgi:hypothetical protein